MVTGRSIAALLIAAVSACASGSGSSSDKATSCQVDGNKVTFRADERASLPAELTSCPPVLLCPTNRSLVSFAGKSGTAFDFHCTEALGAFDGRAVGFERRDGDTVFARGKYRLEAPDGRWTCTHSGSSATLSWRFDAEAFAGKLWGTKLSLSLAPKNKDQRLGPRAHNMCPPVDEWAQVANNGFTIEPMGSLVERGVVTDVRFTP